MERRKIFRKPHANKSQYKLKKAIDNIQSELRNHKTPIPDDVSDLNNFLYACILLAIETAQLEKQCIVETKTRSEYKTENWKNNLTLRINTLRSETSKITQMTSPNPSKKIEKNTAKMKRKYKIHSEVKRQEKLLNNEFVLLTID